MPLLPCVELNPATPATAAVIWLHGLGADGHDFEPIVPELGLPASLAVRFVFPHAPSIPVTINNGYRMPAWYDILDMDLSRRADRAGLLASAARVAELLDRERERTLLHRAPPWRRALVLALAVIPVFLTFGAAIGFVGALRQFNSAIFDSAVAGSSTDSQATTPAPPPTGDQPEVVLIQPYAISAPPADTAVPQKR